MSHAREAELNRPGYQATLLETQLDSIALTLGKMRAKVKKDQVLTHMTSTERAELEAALARAESRLSQLHQALQSVH